MRVRVQACQEYVNASSRLIAQYALQVLFRPCLHVVKQRVRCDLEAALCQTFKQMPPETLRLAGEGATGFQLRQEIVADGVLRFLSVRVENGGEQSCETAPSRTKTCVV